MTIQTSSNYNSFLFNDITVSDSHVSSLRHLCASRHSRDGLFFCSQKLAWMYRQMNYNVFLFAWRP